MSPKANPWDKAARESFTKMPQDEEAYRTEYRHLEHARAAIAGFLAKVYKENRLHSALGYLTVDLLMHEEIMPPPPANSGLAAPAAAIV
jgi:putative transposase